MLRIAIDGACRRNGKPDCISAGGVFILHYKELELIQTKILSNYEMQSTNQRGELLALLTALDYVCSANIEAQIITDSEYIFNTMTKEWYSNWERKGWVTSLNEPVKNIDMWREIAHAYRKCSVDVTFYHIKGHCIPFGKVTASNLLNGDPTGAALLKAVNSKYELVKESKAKNITEATELSEKNNGFALPDEQLKAFIVANIVSDAIATRCVEAANALNCS